MGRIPELLGGRSEEEPGPVKFKGRCRKSSPPPTWTFREWNEDAITQKGTLASENSNTPWEAGPTGCHRRGAGLEVQGPL